MSFHDSAIFPENYSFGTSGGPGHSTRIIAGDSGAEVRVQRWAGARNRYTVRNVNKKEADAAALISFVRGREGSAHGFRLKDHLDWSTGRNHVSPPSTNVADRVLLQQGGDGTATQFQLTKPYDSGGVRKWRTITRPMPTGYQTVTRNGVETIANQVWVNDTLLDEGTAWTLDPSSGIISFATAPENGAAVYASFAYHVPCRFSETVDDLLSGSVDAGGLASFDRIEIDEIVDQLEGSECWDPGGASIVQWGENYDASLAYGVYQIHEPDGPGIATTLPDFNALPLGYPVEMFNNSAHSLEVRTHTGAFFFNLGAGEAIRMKVGGNNGVATGWFAI